MTRVPALLKMTVQAFEAVQSKLLSASMTMEDQDVGRSLCWRRTTETHVDPHDLPDRRVELL